MSFWPPVFAGLVLAIAAGQAVGPVIAGQVGGETGVTISQALLLSPQGSGGHRVSAMNLENRKAHGEPYGGDWVVTVDQGRNQFRVAIESVVGRALTIGLSIENESTLTDTPLNGEVRLELPAGIRAEVNYADGGAVEGRLAQLNRTTWLFSASGDSGDYDPGKSDILITFRPAPNAAPGFYGIRGSIRQVSH